MIICNMTFGHLQSLQCKYLICQGTQHIIKGHNVDKCYMHAGCGGEAPKKCEKKSNSKKTDSVFEKKHTVYFYKKNIAFSNKILVICKFKSLQGCEISVLKS